MSRTDDELIAAIASALDPDLELVRDRDDALVIVDVLTSRAWPLSCVLSDLAQQVGRLEASGMEAGIGGQPGSGAVSPGVALLAIHLDEAIRTASPTANHLELTAGGATALP